ncbi:hypothetical protein KA005_79030, partial [bacterium]|nr:hypothetical protein [bacterium]
ISNIFAKKRFYEIVTSYRKQFELDVARIIQEKLDALNSGLEIISINMKDAHPPIFISSSFEEVIAAYQEKERLINQAIGYRNESIPQARGRSQSIVREAEGYVLSKTARSVGEASRFVMQLEEYEKSKRIIKDTLYFDFIKEAFSENRKIVVDPESGFPEIYMDFDKLIKPYQQ